MKTSAMRRIIAAIAVLALPWSAPGQQANPPPPQDHAVVLLYNNWYPQGLMVAGVSESTNAVPIKYGMASADAVKLLLDAGYTLQPQKVAGYFDFWVKGSK